MKWLPMADVAVDNNISDLTMCTPMIAVHAVDLLITFQAGHMWDSNQ